VSGYKELGERKKKGKQYVQVILFFFLFFYLEIKQTRNKRVLKDYDIFLKIACPNVK
jgi:hypothetical protein